MTERRSVILLDLDHTLVHTTMGVQYPDYDLIPHDHMRIHIRPYVREFLHHLIRSSHIHEFGFWTCGTREYAEHVVKGLLRYANAPDWPMRILLTRNDAVMTNGTYVKDLSLVRRRFNVDHLLLLDDSNVHLSIPSNVPDICLVPVFVASNPNAVHDRFLLNMIRISEIHITPLPVVHKPKAIRPTSMTQVTVSW